MSLLKEQILNCPSIENLQSKIFKGTKNSIFEQSTIIMKRTQQFFEQTNLEEIHKMRVFYNEDTMRQMKQAVSRAIQQDKNAKKNKKVTMKDKKLDFLK